MSLYNIPKELYLDQLANYNESRLRLHLVACFSFVDPKHIVEDKLRIFTNFFRNKEHASIALLILGYVLEKNPDIKGEVLINRFIASLYESGFFA